MVGDFDRLYDEGERVVLDPSTVHTHGPPSLPGKDKNIVSSATEKTRRSLLVRWDVVSP